jgi:hypothetical protein
MRAFCDDSGDLPMTRVKMNAKHEYEYIANFKVLQNVFKAKKIEKVRRPLCHAARPQNAV